MTATFGFPRCGRRRSRLSRRFTLGRSDTLALSTFPRLLGDAESGGFGGLEMTSTAGGGSQHEVTPTPTTISAVSSGTARSARTRRSDPFLSSTPVGGKFHRQISSSSYFNGETTGLMGARIDRNKSGNKLESSSDDGSEDRIMVGDEQV